MLYWLLFFTYRVRSGMNNLNCALLAVIFHMYSAQQDEQHKLCLNDVIVHV